MVDRRFGRSRNWKRVLHFGMEGLDVKWLQEKLLSLGYHAGEPDGVYGWLTEDAVRLFQRDHGLRVDGLAGPSVFELLEDPLLSQSIIIHTAERRQTVQAVAQNYGVGVGAISGHGAVSAKRALKPGQRLVIQRKSVIGMTAPDQSPEFLRRTLLQRRRDLSTLMPMWFHLHSDGSITGQPDAEAVRIAQSQGILVIPAFHNMAGPAEFWGERPSSWLRNKRWVQSVCTRISEAIKGPDYAGAHLELRGLRHGDGVYLLRMVRRLASRLSAIGRSLSIGIRYQADNPIAAFGTWYDHSYRALGDHVETIVLRLDRIWDNPDKPVQPSPEAGRVPVHLAKTWVSKLLTELPPWKVVLSIPVYSLDFNVSERGAPVALPFERANAIVQRVPRGGGGDGRGVKANYSYVAERAEHLLFIQQAAQLVQYLELVKRFNLRGLAVWPLSWEDKLIWRAIKDQFGLLKTLPGSDTGGRGAE